jgi:predicted ATPase with chaperone activity
MVRRLITILPAMTLAEALETTRMHRVAGLTGARTTLVTTRPCRAPHHTISDVGLIGGGQARTPCTGMAPIALHGRAIWSTRTAQTGSHLRILPRCGAPYGCFGPGISE